MVISLSLVGCSDNFPEVSIKKVDLAKQRVQYFDLVDKENIKVAARRDESGKLVFGSLSQVDKGFCFTGKEAAEVLAWARRNKERCE